MPSIALAAFIGSAAFSLADVVLSETVHNDLSRVISDLPLGLSWALVFTPVYIAIHRFIILNDVTSTYRLEIGNPRFLRFLAFSAIVYAATLAPLVAVDLLPDSKEIKSPLGHLVIFIVLLGALFANTMILARLIILFPAISIDAPGAGWVNAWRDTRGHLLSIVAITFLAWLPVIAVCVFVIAYTGFDSTLGEITFALGGASCTVLEIAIASRLYETLARSVALPDGVVSEDALS